MPGAGKSTVGVILAKMTGLAFNDTDLAIQLREGATLQQIVDGRGHLALRQIEEQVLLEIDLERAVISTGGSVIYSPAIMQRLQQAGPVIYLYADLSTLEQRVATAPMRGIASDGAQSFADIYHERTPLYERYANITIDATVGSADRVASAIIDALRQY